MAHCIVRPTHKAQASPMFGPDSAKMSMSTKQRGKKTCVSCSKLIPAASSACPECAFVFREKKLSLDHNKGQRGRKSCTKCNATIPSASSSCAACGHVFRLRTAAQTASLKRGRPTKSDSPNSRPRGRPRKGDEDGVETSPLLAAAAAATASASAVVAAVHNGESLLVDHVAAGIPHSASELAAKVLAEAAPAHAASDESDNEDGKRGRPRK